MGGRGASSGMSDRGNKYGTQYHMVLESGNIKFVKQNDRINGESLLETMTRGRVYVTVGGNDLLKIIYFDNENKHAKEINLDHSHNGMRPHVHHGYYHSENDGPKGGTNLTPEEKRMVDRVEKIWYKHIGK